MTRWFRLYDDILDDPKVQMLSPELFKAWVNILAITSRNKGRLPSVAHTAFALRITPSDAQSRIDDLILAGLIDLLADGMVPHNWSRRQWASDESADRVRRHRERKKTQPHETAEETQRNDDVTVTVTPPDTESDTDTDTESEKKQILAPLATPKSCKRGARLPDDWALPPDWRDWVRVNCPAAGDVAIDREAMRFANHWQSKAGQHAAKLDWRKTWQNWCLTAFATAPVRTPLPSAVQPGRARAALERMLAEAAT